MKFGVVVFPGSNCDTDAYYAVRDGLRAPVDYIWHESKDVAGYDCLVLPGGFAYGDYLRAGAIARFSPVMEAVERFARAGGLVLGICNGFQVLLECGLLPGAMLRNDSLQFRCMYVNLRVENPSTAFTNRLCAGQVLRIPIAHGEGNYYADERTVDLLETKGRVLFRYCEPDGEVTRASNPNGAVRNIAGILNEEGNVAGMMPHPERAYQAALGSADGLEVFRSIASFIQGPRRAAAAGGGRA
ncbi:MAG: phosphoribosylformylglycinamidine synthase subunit PurQ [Firmicutes bacterium]|nr:phosphoribosylformylglycinamidine synthase subunit PurQ [Bacillota bacterium]